MNLLTKDYFTENSSVAEVQQALELLEHDLVLMDMNQLRNFNRTYLTITRNVRQAKMRNIFEYEEFLDTFDVRFAHYYTNALHAYLCGEYVAPAWKNAFDHAKEENCTPLMALALGVNAHVNNDIPQVLNDTLAQDKHYEDFTVVNEIIGSSLDQALDDIHGSESPLNPDHPILRPAYKITMKRLIKKWRQNAWDSYKQLSAGTLSIKSVEDDARATAQKLLLLPI